MDSLSIMTLTYSVSQLNRYVKDLLSSDDLLNGIRLRGEASNVTRHASGHLYFTLKDAECQISCVMWRSDAVRLRFPVEPGAQYIAYGRVTIYEKQGKIQFSVELLEPDGLGALHVAYERLKARLSGEELFDEDRKRSIPFLPRHVGLVTSPTGAAVHDIVRVLRERHPRIDIVLIPALVQGDLAPESIAAAIGRACEMPDVDLLIVGRGGGSLEDLWAFNDERVVRAIADCSLPVISAVGHETDVTLADFAADARAPTPTAAALQAVPPVEDLRVEIHSLLVRLTATFNRRLSEERRRIGLCLERAAFSHPLDRIERRRRELDPWMRRVEAGGRAVEETRRARIMELTGRLDALSPLGVLARGYAIPRSAGAVVRSVRTVGAGDSMEVLLRDGIIDCEVKAVRQDTDSHRVRMHPDEPVGSAANDGSDESRGGVRKES